MQLADKLLLQSTALGIHSEVLISRLAAESRKLSWPETAKDLLVLAYMLTSKLGFVRFC